MVAAGRVKINGTVARTGQSVDPTKDEITVDGKRIKLTPGMNLTAEIKTGKRRVIDYLLSPVQTHAQESMRER